MATDCHESIYACKCLNIRICPQQGASAPQYRVPPDSDSEYCPFYVDDQGISVIHPQLTLRTRSRPEPIDETPSGSHPRCARYTSSTCLICQMVVYRVHQVVPLEVEGKDGPLLPTNDWVERETLKSCTGWIEINNNCLSGQKINQYLSSSFYSPTFNLVVPSRDTPSSRSEIQLNDNDSQSGRSRSPSRQEPYLSHLRALFPPAPFTPSHPAFTHLASIASRKSEDLRRDAEERIALAVKGEADGIEAAENELRREVEELWKKFREGIEEQRSQLTNRPRRDSDTWSGTTVGRNSLRHSTVAVRDFVPTPTPVVRSSPSSAARMSTLSASLATSSFHHPSALQQASSSSHVPRTRDHSPPPYISSPSSPSIIQSPSTSSSSSSPSISTRADAGGSHVLSFKRNMDQTKDTAASFRWFTIEAEMEKSAQSRDRRYDGPQLSDVENAGSGSQSKGVNGVRRNKKDHSGSRPRSGRDNSTSTVRKVDDEAVQASEVRLDKDTKGKRKVSFDVNRNDVPVDAETKQETGTSKRDGGDMMFHLEDEDGHPTGTGMDSWHRPVLTLLEPANAPIRAPRRRVPRTSSGGGLPESFSSLRPASLPSPSNIRPPRIQRTDSDPPSPRTSARSSPVIPKAPAPRKQQRRSVPLVEEDFDAFDEREAEILKLVAADTPSHRGAWKKDSKAWQLFVRRQGGNTSYPLIPEEGEEDDDPFSHSVSRIEEDMEDDDSESSDMHTVPKWKPPTAPISGSLPIGIHPLNKPTPILSLASYQPKTSLSDRSSVLAQSKGAINSTALRKAAYAERDRSRSFDPGALDFEEIDEEDEGSDDNVSTVSPPEIGERGRKRALKILQARSELPEAGMWRSLAN